MPDWIAVILLGIIEGVTEFLPVSSTGHLLIAERMGWLPHQSELFNVVIQCGAVLAVLLVFFRRAQSLVVGWREPVNRDYLVKLLVAFLITGVAGLLIKKLGLIKLDDASVNPVLWATLIGGILILAIEWMLKGKTGTSEITWRIALMVAAGQLLAMVFPGTSRSGATILIALAMGVNRPAATEFSFLLGIPTLLAAGAYEIFSAIRHHEAGNENWPMVLLGSVAAMITAFIVVKWLLRFVQTHTFTVFGWYRIALGIALLFLVMR
ncbi:MAG: undecaprenyl-diphosphate phosphatase [Akkermansiaceae bacterium]|nr:undecaprenyl-diphosphate phosphatase [Verrucomicrobiales bacterium]